MTIFGTMGVGEAHLSYFRDEGVLTGFAGDKEIYIHATGDIGDGRYAVKPPERLAGQDEHERIARMANIGGYPGGHPGYICLGGVNNDNIVLQDPQVFNALMIGLEQDKGGIVFVSKKRV